MYANKKHSTNSKADKSNKKVVLQLNNVKKIYKIGEQTITALKQINFNARNKSLSKLLNSK